MNNEENNNRPPRRGPGHGPGAVEKPKDFKIHPDNSAYNCIFLVEILFNRKKTLV